MSKSCDYKCKQFTCANNSFMSEENIIKVLLLIKKKQKTYDYYKRKKFKRKNK